MRATNGDDSTAWRGLSPVSAAKIGRLQSCSIRADGLEDGRTPRLGLWIPAFAGKTGWVRFHCVARLCNRPGCKKQTLLGSFTKNPAAPPPKPGNQPGCTPIWYPVAARCESSWSHQFHRALARLTCLCREAGTDLDQSGKDQASSDILPGHGFVCNKKALYEKRMRRYRPVLINTIPHVWFLPGDTR